MSKEPHPLYTGEAAKVDSIVVIDDTGEEALKHPIRFKLQNTEMPDGKMRDQSGDAAEHMRYAATLGLPALVQAPRPRMGRAIIIGGAPSVKEHLEEIRALAADKHNAVFAINWTHTWLIQNGIVPRGCVFFEIDAEPDTVLEAAHPNVTYFICSHCHPRSFDALEGFKRVMWHTTPNSDIEKVVGDELFADSALVGGGLSTFSRTITIALYLGYRHLDVFGCDSSSPIARSRAICRLL